MLKSIIYLIYHCIEDDQHCVSLSKNSLKEQTEEVLVASIWFLFLDKMQIHFLNDKNLLKHTFQRKFKL